MKQCCLIYSILIFFLLINALDGIENEGVLARRIQSHLTLNDAPSAYDEAKQGLSIYPQSKILLEGAIRSSARLGEEQRVLQLWEKYIVLFPNQSENREIIEEMAWGILSKASNSSSLVMRQMSLLAACFSQEGKGVAIIHKGMRDSNHAIRGMAVKLAGHFRDHKLIEEMKRVFNSEKVWSIRQQIIESIGKMHITEMQPALELILAAEDTHPSEKRAASKALLSMLDALNRPEIERLSLNKRAGLRCVACQAITFFQSERDLDVLLSLLKDPSAEVRIEAYQALGQLRPEDHIEQILQSARLGIKDLNYQAALSACWLLALYKPEEGMRAFGPFINHQRREVRLLAASALSATGQTGSQFALEQFHSHTDPYVRLNLAIGLIGQRIAIPETTAFIRSHLMSEKEKWGMVEVGLFHAITSKGTASSNDSLLTPEIENQIIRLELLNLLAILKEPSAQDAIKDFLKERSWGISSAASASLLTEGDEAAIDLVKKLLEDSQQRIRLQAALILSLWGKEESAIEVLKEEYGESEFEMKGRILESLGRIGSIDTLPFLIEVWKEPSQTLRVIAAMAVIQCLYH